MAIFLTICILLVLSLISNFILLIFGIRMVKKNEVLADYINEFDNRQDNTLHQLETMLSEMREIDLRGSFESDDEVGGVFSELKDIIEQYKNLI